MRTLLKLFFLPYLKFLWKLHLIVIPVVAMICILRIEELMMLLPGLYPFALYACTNRHQFKDNIPWMLATFNKRTLITYHLVSQTLVSLMLMILSTLGVVATMMINITFFPAALEKSSQGTQEKLVTDLTENALAWFSTKEQLIYLIVAIFFLTTLYSPVSLKDSLRQFDEDVKDWKKRLQIVGTIAVAVILVLEAKALGIKQFILPLLCLVVVGQLLYLMLIYNRAFTLFNPKHYRRVFPVAGFLAVMFSVGLHALSLNRFKHSQIADQRVAELSFLGQFAPKLTDQEFIDLVKDVKNPSKTLEVFAGKREIPYAAKVVWVQEAKSFSAAIGVLKTMNQKELAVLQQAQTWASLDKLYKKLASDNPAAAQYTLSSLTKHLAKEKWAPSNPQSLAQRSILEQVAILEWQRHSSPEVYVKTLQHSDVNSEALNLHLDRTPAAIKP